MLSLILLLLLDLSTSRVANILSCIHTLLLHSCDVCEFILRAILHVAGLLLPLWRHALSGRSTAKVWHVRTAWIPEALITNGKCLTNGTWGSLILCLIRCSQVCWRQRTIPSVNRVHIIVSQIDIADLDVCRAHGIPLPANIAVVKPTLREISSVLVELAHGSGWRLGVINLAILIGRIDYRSGT